jgi:hypothetical protein
MPILHPNYAGIIKAVLAAEYDKDSDDHDDVSQFGLSFVYFEFLLISLLPICAQYETTLHH